MGKTALRGLSGRLPAPKRTAASVEPITGAGSVAVVADDSMEGWYTDPFGRHEARWMSAGTPTKLVRDGGVESYDNPPDEEPTRSPARIEADPATSYGGDLRRADDAERDPAPFSPQCLRRADEAERGMPSPEEIADAISIGFERTRPSR